MSGPRETILIVDDIPDNIKVLGGILKAEYDIKVATSGPMALAIAESLTSLDLVLLDIMMPGMDGYEVCEKLKGNVRTGKIPVIFVTAKGEIEDESKGFERGAVDYLTKPVSPPIVLARVKTHLSLYNQQKMLARTVQEQHEELIDTRLEIIRRLGRAAEYKDNETGLHVIRMSKYSYYIARAYGLSEEESVLILNAAPMHDIGKIGIPDSILLKPGKLDDSEWELMRRHPLIGARIIGEHNSELLRAAKIAALTHHEKWDGTGYPKGLSGENIHLYGRIIAIADVFDALTSKRPYKNAWPVEKAVDLINSEAGSHFDPKLTEAFVSQLPKVLEIKEEFGE